MNNRSTLLPQKQTNKSIPSSYNKQDLSRARNSIAGQFNYPRGTMVTLGKQNDPRPITDIKFKEENVTKIFDFLIQESYDKNASKKTIISPTSREFYYMVEFIYKKIIPDFTGTISEENIFSTLITLRYPGTLNKNHLYAIGAPNTSPYIIAVLSWMIDLANYVQSMCNNISIDNQLNNNSELDDEDKLFNAYVIKAYKATNIDEVREQFRNELLLKTETNMNEKNSIDNILHDVINEINQAKESSKALMAIKAEHQNKLSQIQKKKEVHSQKEAEINSLKNKVAEKQTQYEQKSLKVDNTKKELESYEQKIKEQAVSYDEYSKMTELKHTLDLSYETLTKRRDDAIERYNQLKKKLSEQKQKIIQSQINTYDKFNVKNIDIDKYITQCQSDIDPNEIKGEIQKLNAVLIQNVNILIAENKEKDKVLLSLQSDLLRLDDKVKETKMKINQKENECKAKEGEINNDRSIDNTFVNTYSEELTKTNDLIQKAKSDIIEKEKQLDIVNQKEKDLIDLYDKSETEAEEYIKQLENEYNETIAQVEKMKKENIQLIRKNYKALDSVFNQIKTEIEQ